MYYVLYIIYYNNIIYYKHVEVAIASVIERDVTL